MDESSERQQAENVDRDAFVEAMRQVAATVTVVTTQAGDGPAGATVSAFTSLSADPPSVLVCLRADSRISRAVGESGLFCVNVLPEHASDLALRFAGAFDADRPDRFEGLDLRETPYGPILPQSLVFTCRLERQITHGSHAICIGGVTGITQSGAKPLAYMHGDFHVVRPHGENGD